MTRMILSSHRYGCDCSMNSRIQRRETAIQMAKLTTMKDDVGARRSFCIEIIIVDEFDPINTENYVDRSRDYGGFYVPGFPSLF